MVATLSGWIEDLILYGPLFMILFALGVLILTIIWAAISERRRK